MAVKLSISSWTKFKKNLSEDLTTTDIRNIKFFCKDFILAGRAEKIVDALSLLEELENLDIFNEHDVSQLAKIFEEINRKDLVRKTDNYTKNVKKHPSENKTTFAKQPSEDMESSFPFVKKNMNGGSSGAYQNTNTSPENTKTPAPKLLSPDHFRRRNVTADVRTTTADAMNDDRTQIAFPTSNIRPPEYSMNRLPRGMCVIFSNEFKLKQNVAAKQRSAIKGTETDIKNLEETFDWLGFKVETYRDTTCVEMTRIMQSIAKEDHSNYDCFVCCISTHGFEGGVYGDNGEAMNIKDIQDIYVGDKCPTLINKPKLFFIQTSQEVSTIETDSPMPPQTIPVPASNKEIPQNVDVLLFISASQGDTSNASQGSWFISSLTNVLKKYAINRSLTEMILEINQMAKNGIRYEIRDTLTHALYFRPGKNFRAGMLENDTIMKQPIESP